MPNYMIKIYWFFSVIRLQAVCLFRSQYTKIYLQCYRIIKIVKYMYMIYIYIYIYIMPITAAARCRAGSVFVRLNAGIVGSNPTQRHGCLRLLCVGNGLATGWSPFQGVSPIVLQLRNWSETKRFTDVLCSKREQQERERESCPCD
jgi:hypothetical protein